MKFLTDKQAVSFAESVGRPLLALPKPPRIFIQFIVTIIPWLVLIIALLCLVATLGLLPALVGLNNYITDLSGQRAFDDWDLLNLIPSFIFTVLVGVLYFMAFNPLRKRQLTGWMYLFWGNALGIISTVWFAIADQTITLWNVLSLVVGLYVMYQIKGEYKS